MALPQLLATIDNNHSRAFGNDKYVKQKKRMETGIHERHG